MLFCFDKAAQESQKTLYNWVQGSYMYNRDLTNKKRQDRLTSEIYRHLFTNTFAFA